MKLMATEESYVCVCVCDRYKNSFGMDKRTREQDQLKDRTKGASSIMTIVGKVGVVLQRQTHERLNNQLAFYTLLPFQLGALRMCAV